MQISDLVRKVAVEVCRLFLAALFLFSGTVKAIDPVGGAIKIGDYLTSFGLDSLLPFKEIFSFGLAALEFSLGACVLLGAYRKYTSIVLMSETVVRGSALDALTRAPTLYGRLPTTPAAGLLT